MNVLDEEAWRLYCEETSGDLDVRDSLEQLSEKVKEIYRAKVLARHRHD